MPRAPESRTSDFVLYAISVMLALVVWIIVKQRNTETIPVKVPLKPVNAPENVYFELEPPYLTVRLTYPKSLERELTGDNFRIEVDLKGLADSAGVGAMKKSTQPVLLDDVRVADSLAAQIHPVAIVGSSRVQVSAQFYTVEVRPRPNLVGPPREGFVLDPGRVSVAPESLLMSRINPSKQRLPPHPEDPVEVRTQPLDLTDKYGIVAKHVGLELPPDLVRLPDQPTPDVQVTVDLVEREDSREFPDVPFAYQPMKVSVGAAVLPPAVTVRVRGPASAVAEITTDTLRLTPRGLTSEEPGYEAEVAYTVDFENHEDLRSRITSVEVDPPTVSVRFFSRAEDHPTSSALRKP